MKKCRVSPVAVVTVGPPPEMDQDGRRKRSSSPQQPTPLSSMPELLLVGQLNFPGVHKSPRGRHTVEDTDDEGDVRRPSEGLSPLKPSPDAQPLSPRAPTGVSETSTTPRHKHKRKNRKPHRSPSAHAMTAGLDPASPGTMSLQSGGGASGQPAETGQPSPAVRTPDRADQRNESSKAAAGLARQQGTEELQTIDQLWKRRSPFRRDTTSRPSPGGGCNPQQQRSPPTSNFQGTPPRLAGRRSPQADLRRLAGSLDLTSSPAPIPRHDLLASPPPPRPSPSEMTECPFALPPAVGTGFLLEPPVASSSQAPMMDQRKFRLTRTRSLPDLRQEAAAPEFLRNRLILQTDDTVYLPFILRKEYVIRTKLRVSFSLLKPPVVKRSHSEGYITDVTFLHQAYCSIWEDADTEVEDSEWRVDEGCNFFDLCYFRCKCCRKRLNRTIART